MAFSVYLARHNLFIDLDWLVSEKGGVTSSHLVDKDSKCPPVHSFVVALRETENSINLKWLYLFGCDPKSFDGKLL